MWEIFRNGTQIYQETWAQEATKQVATKIKTVPVHRAFLNKKGEKCIVLPTEENRKAAVAALKADFYFIYLSQTQGP